MREEKRRRIRVPVHFTARLEVPGGEKFDVETENISLNGILIRTERTVAVGAEVTVVLSLSTAVEIRITGCVVRSTGDGLAIGYRAIDEEGFPHLKRIVEYNVGDADLVDRELREAGFLER